MVKAKMKFEEIRKAVKRLPMRQRIRLAEELNKDTWQKQFAALLKEIRAGARKHPISQKEINKICEETRQELYDQRRR